MTHNTYCDSSNLQRGISNSKKAGKKRKEIERCLRLKDDQVHTDDIRQVTNEKKSSVQRQKKGRLQVIIYIPFPNKIIGSP